jgi:hypothetical protein
LSTADIVLIITVLTTAIVTIIDAWRGEKRGKVRVAEAAAAVSAAADVAAVVTARSDGQDQKLDEIHEATNGGVQALRDKVIVANERIDQLEALLKTAVAELRAARVKPA